MDLTRALRGSTFGLRPGLWVGVVLPLGILVLLLPRIHLPFAAWLGVGMEGPGFLAPKSMLLMGLGIRNLKYLGTSSGF